MIYTDKIWYKIMIKIYNKQILNMINKSKIIIIYNKGSIKVNNWFKIYMFKLMSGNSNLIKNNKKIKISIHLLILF